MEGTFCVRVYLCLVATFEHCHILFYCFQVHCTLSKGTWAYINIWLHAFPVQKLKEYSVVWLWNSPSSQNLC